MIRLRAGVSFALAEAMGDGHCGLPYVELTALAEKLLDVPSGLIAQAMQEELAKGTVTADQVRNADCIFLTGLYQAERIIAERLVQIRTGDPPWQDINAE